MNPCTLTSSGMSGWFRTKSTVWRMAVLVLLNPPIHLLKSIPQYSNILSCSREMPPFGHVLHHQFAVEVERAAIGMSDNHHLFHLQFINAYNQAAHGTAKRVGDNSTCILNNLPYLRSLDPKQQV